jgi:enamine deaminase RidA (YjgF/YER057c/UK114 family)
MLLAIIMLFTVSCDDRASDDCPQYLWPDPEEVLSSFVDKSFRPRTPMEEVNLAAALKEMRRPTQTPVLIAARMETDVASLSGRNVIYIAGVTGEAPVRAVVVAFQAEDSQTRVCVRGTDTGLMECGESVSRIITGVGFARLVPAADLQAQSVPLSELTMDDVFPYTHEPIAIAIPADTPAFVGVLCQGGRISNFVPLTPNALLRTPKNSK